MKKRIFTLLALGMLIGGVSSTLSAKVVLDSVKIVRSTGNEIYEKKDAKKSPLSVTTMRVRLSSLGTAERSETVYFTYDETAQYLGLPASYTFHFLDTVATTFKWFDIEVKNDWNMPNSISGSKGIVFASLDGSFPTAATRSDTVTCYNYPTFKVEYMATTAQFVGSLRIASITGCNPKLYDKMNRKLQKDSVYTYFTDTVVFHPFSDLEVANLTYGDKILVTSPWGNEYLVDIPGIRNDDDVPPGTIQRAVTVPVVSDATLNIESGVHQVASSYDFSFIIKPTGANEDLEPLVTTGRTDIPDSEGITYQKLSDGSWLVTIIRVKTNINLSIGFTVGNASIESNSVWANGGQLYVNAATSSKASIYSITGALVKTAAIAAGETANISLPTGFYVVTVNGKAYKVIVK